MTELRTDSLDYRTELLSPDVTGGPVALASDSPAWRLNMEGIKLPAERNNMSSCFGLGSYVQSLRRQKKIAEYYKRQNKLLKGFNELDSFTELGSWPGSLTEDEKTQLASSERIAIYASNAANLVLFLAKVYASVESRSLAVIASTLDSLLDLLSGFILWFTAHAMRKPNQYNYPIGKHRMQPVGIVVFASVMATLGLQILFESGRQLVTKTQPDRDPEKEKWMIGIMVSATVIKFVLMVYCRRFKNEIVRAYAQDHLFDVITNGIGLASAVLAIRFYWWIDPLGAIIISLYTIGNWAKTVMENVWSLIGKTAPAEYLAKLTYLIWNHDKQIKHIDTVRAYTFGINYFVEVDIVLPGEMSLSEAHNIGEALQEKLENLPERMTKLRKLNRTTAHRISMLRTMVSQLVKHERIETTVAKAKEVRRQADRMVQLGKDGSLCAARRAAAFVRGDDVIHKLFTELAYRYKDRVGGYTRMLRTRIRVGDAAPMAYIEFIDRDNELRQSKPPAPQPPPPRVPLDPWARSKLCKQFAPPKEDKSKSTEI
ncbi:hypothetical protein ACLB2K_025533 [Fragaria x ananassa]